MKKLYIALAIVIGFILIHSFKPAPTNDYEIVFIRGKEFIKSRVSGGYVYTKIN